MFSRDALLSGFYLSKINSFPCSQPEFTQECVSKKRYTNSHWVLWVLSLVFQNRVFWGPGFAVQYNKTQHQCDHVLWAFKTPPFPCLPSHYVSCMSDLKYKIFLPQPLKQLELRQGPRPLASFCCFVFFEIESHYITQANPKLMNVLLSIWAFKYSPSSQAPFLLHSWMYMNLLTSAFRWQSKEQ